MASRKRTKRGGGSTTAASGAGKGDMPGGEMSGSFREGLSEMPTGGGDMSTPGGARGVGAPDGGRAGGQSGMEGGLMPGESQGMSSAANAGASDQDMPRGVMLGD